MAQHYNPRLENTADLIFYLDAGNQRSYPGTGSIWYDLTSNQNHFTLFNSPSHIQNGSTGTYFTFNGTNQYARSINAINFNAYSNLTLEIGFRSTATSTTQVLYETTGTGGSTATGGITLLMNSSNTATVSNNYLSNWQGFGTRLITFSGASTFNAISDVFVKTQDPTGRLVSINATTATFETNVSVTTATSTTTNGLSFSNTWTYIASRGGTSNFFAGDIAYVRAWGRKNSVIDLQTLQTFNQLRQLNNYSAQISAGGGGGGASLYTFTTFTFTNAGFTGRIGPTLANFLAAYNTATYPWLNNTAYYNVDSTFRGYQLWTVPVSGNYQFQVRGASSGSLSSKGAAALITATLNLNQNDKIWIICGQRANSNTEVGEGGSWVVLSNAGAVAGSTALIVAGGAGDTSFGTSPVSSADAQTTDNLNASVFNQGSYNPANPTTGNGGTVTTVGTGQGSGGGGFNTDGAFNGAGYKGSGQSFFNGLRGGLYQNTVYDTTTVAGGGFGGGGARNGSFGTGAGGGYTGGAFTGDGTLSIRMSTGGSSYVIPSATNVTRALASAGAPSATLVEGQVIVTKV